MTQQKRRSQKLPGALRAPVANSKEKMPRGPAWASEQCAMFALSASINLTQVQPLVVRALWERQHRHSWRDLRHVAHSEHASLVSFLSVCCSKSFVTFVLQASSNKAIIESQSARPVHQANTTRTWHVDLVLRARQGATQKYNHHRSASNVLRER